MSDRIVIKGLLCLDETGRYDLMGFHDWSPAELVEYMREGIDNFRGDKRWGLATQVYEIELDVPRPLLNRLSLTIKERSFSPDPTVESAKLKRVPAPVDSPPAPNHAPKPASAPPEAPIVSERASIVSPKVPIEKPQAGSFPPKPPVEEQPDAEAGDSILDRIEKKLRDAGGSLPWTSIEFVRPVAIKHDVFHAAIAKRFVITKSGRGERVSLRESQS